MIRSIRTFEVSQVSHLIQETIDISYATIYPVRAVGFFKKFHSRDKILQRISTGNMLVFEIEKEIVATGALVGNKIEGVFIKPDFQGEGLGRKMMKELEKLAKSRGIREVVLHISLPSKKFYDDLGYTILEESRVDVGEGQYLMYWKAHKEL